MKAVGGGRVGERYSRCIVVFAVGDARSRPGQLGHFKTIRREFRKEARIKAGWEEKPGPGRIELIKSAALREGIIMNLVQRGD